MSNPFKVGDRVEYQDQLIPLPGIPVGTRGTVTDMFGVYCVIKFDNGVIENVHCSTVDLIFPTIPVAWITREMVEDLGYDPEQVDLRAMIDWFSGHADFQETIEAYLEAYLETHGVKR